MIRALLVALLIPAAAAAADPQFKLEGNRLVLEGTVPFQAGTAKLLPDADSQLAHVKAYLDAKSYITLLRIEVHGDGDGKAEATQALSEKRALAVAAELVAKG